MKISNRAAAAALALSCLSIGTTATAAPAITDMRREPVSIRVSHAGLDLRTAAGRSRFDARVRRAASYACAPRGASAELRVDSERCVQEMVDDAAVQLAALERSGGVQLASLTR